MSSVETYSFLVVGVPLSSIGVELKIEDDTYEIHDERGKPTGEFKTEKVCVIKTQKEELRNKRFSYDTMEKVVGIRDSEYNQLSELQLFKDNSFYETTNWLIGLEFNVRDYKINPNDSSYSFISKINMGDLTQLRLKVLSLLKEKYGYDFSESVDLYYVEIVS